MAESEMVEVVIKMPKEKYDIICSMYGTFPAEMKEWGLEYIKDGTLLLKGHGNLIDRDELLVHERYGIGAVYVDDINDAPTIIEADTQSKEKRKHRRSGDRKNNYGEDHTYTERDSGRNLEL